MERDGERWRQADTHTQTERETQFSAGPVMSDIGSVDTEREREKERERKRKK
jgi:hypothetical protein